MRQESGYKQGRGLFVTILLLGSLGLSACSSILPRSEEQTLSPWNSYAEARSSFEKIHPGTTRYEDLLALGFNPEVTPNISRITYIKLLERFLPNQSISLDDIDPAVSECIRAREACYGLEFTPGEIDRQRFGNAFLDIFGFKRRTRTTGWNFEGLVVINQDLIVYTLAGGNSNIDQLEIRKRPLGPLQEIDIRGNVDI